MKLDENTIEVENVRHFLNELIWISTDSNDPATWECLQNRTSTYNLSAFSQFNGIEKYVYTDFESDIDKAFFSVQSQKVDDKTITNYNLEIIFSDDPDHFFELPHLTELRSELEELHNRIKKRLCKDSAKRNALERCFKPQ